MTIKTNINSLNWKVGLSRFYNVLWVVFAIFSWAAYFENPSTSGFFMFLASTVAMPYAIKQAIMWVGKGFIGPK